MLSAREESTVSQAVPPLDGEDDAVQTLTAKHCCTVDRFTCSASFEVPRLVRAHQSWRDRICLDLH